MTAGPSRQAATLRTKEQAMTADFSELKFDGNHKKSSTAKQALTGLRLVLLSLAIYVALVAATITMALNPELSTMADSGLGWTAALLASLVAFACGAYGTYLVMEALSWAGYVSFFIIASFLIPYFRLISLLLVIVMGIDLVSKGGYRITLFGPPRKVATPAEA
jgi:hypothetical protein